ncbi:rab proteins geranylgeranyltransferase component A 1 isoform X2 [Maniola jurtina]|uniref:rab proteins geranylgeranyltransferase component A 1 isoform X1 n=1 Tax=Maniola jurtina TaxID=191418 RepID=UPI001E68BFA5|nr:rab proteins geranylgeranyltransferase component A 1 isoform X1 [Maniola jurtina]XP_045763213.1 rab proteins geranylgeranyltransferase component A 1 isoform X2 [Maniola jurtina]
MDVDELDLPTDFEVIVVGTGLVESIVAAACSRIGKNVLHLDSRDHYGGLWASHNFDFLQKFIKEVTTDPSRQVQVYNLSEKWYIPKESPQEEKQEGEDGKTEEGKDPAKKVWSQADFATEYRKFNIDMTPKLLFSRGPLVELLISSNIARYAEFRCVTRVLTWLNDKLMPVPCSRADVFATEAVSIVEKRMLMKMLTSIVGYNEEEMDNEFKDWNDKTFQEYLMHKGLTPNLIHYVLYAIAGGTNSMPCLEGVRECKKFLMSLGRYGNTPFLWPMYGSGELPQCFCRLCAVFGGVYCLNRPIDSVEYKTVDDKKVVVIGSKSKTLNCEHLVLGINEGPKDLLSQEPADSSDISRAIFITNGTIMPSEKEPLTLLRFPPLTEDNNAVTVLEVGPATGSCPKGLFVVYFITNKVTDAESDLMPYAEKIFDMSGGDQTETSDKPKCLWSLFYNVKDTCASVKDGVDNVHVCAGPDAGLDFDRAVHQAEQIFKQICPGQEFLPRAPDPEEIVFEDDAAPGPEFRDDEPEKE